MNRGVPLTSTGSTRHSGSKLESKVATTHSLKNRNRGPALSLSLSLTDGTEEHLRAEIDARSGAN